MNRPEPPNEVDRYIRRLFAPDAVAVTRVLARIAGASDVRRRRPGRWVWAVVGVVGLATAVVWRTWPSTPPRTEDILLTITGDRDLVVAERPGDGRRWARMPAQDEARVGNYVIVTGR